MLAKPQDWGNTELRKHAAVEVLERLAMACVRENLLGFEWRESFLILGSSAARLELSSARSFSMDRFDLDGFPESLAEIGPDKAFAWILENLFPDLSPGRRETLRLELENSYLTMALSLEARESLGCGEPGQGTLAQWEGRVWCGHPLHPGARLRSGLTADDNRRYGPEWQAHLRLPLLSVPLTSLNQVGGFSERLAGLYPSLRWQSEPSRALVPVHPWQAENDLEPRFQARFESGELRWSGQDIPARPTMSFRSVILETEVGEDYHLKLPVAVQTTGATRTVSVAATQNGPLMSGFLSRLFSHPEMSDSPLFRYLHLMAEPASFYMQDESPDRSRFLSAILRRGPGEGRLNGNRWLLPAAALLEPRDNPLFLRAAIYYGTDPLALFTAYCRRLIPAQAFLCGQMGIALEAHPQNIVVDFRGLGGSFPDIHFWYRDLGGIRLHPARLSQALQARCWDDRLEVPNFLPGSATSTESERDLSSKFVYSLLQNHLGELIRAISRRGPTEEQLWPVVYEVLDEHRSLLGTDLEERVFASQWDLKAMWTMRLDLAVTEYTFQPVRNPLLAGLGRLRA